VEKEVKRKRGYRIPGVFSSGALMKENARRPHAASNLAEALKGHFFRLEE
jgi:hypothetical protein